tara:strand:- start:2087 stop:2890 length:804 start_codon:yes stop_codon:yes gene_type:complete
MKILLTGSDGFIGQNVYKRINDNIASIEIFCIEKDFINSVNWKTDLEEYVKQNDVVLHIGAISDTMLKDANKMMKYNYLFSKELFDLAQKHNKKVVYSSSAANTGESGTPSNIYGWSKFITEQYGLAKVNNFYALRYFNVYGPGEEHKGKMASVAHQAWKIGSFTLFPKKPKRDFVYIDDVVEATIYPIFNDVKPGVYEVGSGEARTFEDVLDIMEIPFEYKDEYEIPQGYQFFTQSESKLFMEGWQPKYNLEDGLQKYKDYLNGVV